MLLTVLAITIPVLLGMLTYRRPRLGLALMPFVCGIMVLYGFAAQSLVFTVAGFAVLLIVPVVIEANPQTRRPQKEWPSWCFGALLLLVVIILFFSTLVALAWVEWWGLAIVVLVVGVLLAFGYSGLRAFMNRRSTQQIILSTLGACMRQNLPLPTALDMAAHAYRGCIAKTLRAISQWLASGHSVAEALIYGYPACPASIRSTVVAAEPINQLPNALTTVQTDLESQQRHRYRWSSTSLVYPMVLAVITYAVTLGLLTFVLPRFKLVLEEMVQGQLPQSTRWLLNAYEWINAGGWISILSLLAYLLFLPLLTIRRTERPYLRSRLGDWFKWVIPMAHGCQRDRSRMRVIAHLRLALRAGVDLPEAVAQAANLDINYVYRRRLLRWQRDMTAGMPTARAARQAHVGRQLVWAFDQAVPSEGRLDVLELLESFYRNHYNYRLSLLESVLTPCLVFGMALMVGFVAFSIYSPMVQVIQSFSEIYP